MAKSNDRQTENRMREHIRVLCYKFATSKRDIYVFIDKSPVEWRGKNDLVKMGKKYEIIPGKNQQKH